MTFDDYYAEYLSKHRDPRSRTLHLAGNIATALFIVMVLTTGMSWWWLLLSPLVVYPFAVPGHYLFEGNKPAFLGMNPIYAKLSDLRMCWDMLNGRL